MVVAESLVPVGWVLLAIKTMSLPPQGVSGLVEGGGEGGQGASQGSGGVAGLGLEGGMGLEEASKPTSPLTVTIDRLETVTLPVIDTTATTTATDFDAVLGTATAPLSASGVGGVGSGAIAPHPIIDALTAMVKWWQEMFTLLLHHWSVLKQQLKTSAHSGGLYEGVAQPLRQGVRAFRDALESFTVEPTLTALLIVVRRTTHLHDTSFYCTPSYRQ